MFYFDMLWFGKLFLEKKSSAGCLLETNGLMKICIFRGRKIFSSNYVQSSVFSSATLEGSQLIFFFSKNIRQRKAGLNYKSLVWYYKDLKSCINLLEGIQWWFFTCSTSRILAVSRRNWLKSSPQREHFIQLNRILSKKLWFLYTWGIKWSLE